MEAKDAKSLENDLIRAACMLELSMVQTCKITKVNLITLVVVGVNIVL